MFSVVEKSVLDGIGNFGAREGRFGNFVNV